MKPPDSEKRKLQRWRQCVKKMTTSLWYGSWISD